MRENACMSAKWHSEVNFEFCCYVWVWERVKKAKKLHLKAMWIATGVGEVCMLTLLALMYVAPCIA